MSQSQSQNHTIQAGTKKLQCELGKEHAYIRVLSYLYTGDYEEEHSSLISEEDDPELHKHPRVYYMANLLDLDELKNLALKKFRDTLARLWVSERLVECIVEVHENTLPEHDGLREVVVRTIAQHREELLLTQAFRDLLHQGGDFAVDLMQLVANPSHDRY